MRAQWKRRVKALGIKYSIHVKIGVIGNRPWAEYGGFLAEWGVFIEKHRGHMGVCEALVECEEDAPETYPTYRLPDRPLC